MFSKQERAELNKLSKELFGTESRWRKMLDDPKYRIVVDTVETDEKQYVQFMRKKGDNRPGTVVGMDKALERGMVQLKEGENRPKSKRSITREPTFMEMKIAFEQNLDMMLLSYMEKDEQAEVFAKRMLDGNLVYKFYLVKDEKTQQEDVDSLLAMVPDDLREKIVAAIVSYEKVNDKDVYFDVLHFLGNITFAKNNKEAADAEYEKIMSDARANKEYFQKMNAKRSFIQAYI